MNLDDLLKSIRDEDDDDSKGGKDLDDLLESIRDEDTKIDPNKLFSTKKFTNPLVGQRFAAPAVKPNLTKPQTLEPVVVNVDPEKLIPQDEGENDEIIEKLNELIEVIKADNALEEARQDYDKKIEFEEKRKEREKRIEAGKIFGISRTADKVIKKSQSIFDSVIKFLTFTLLGQIVKLVTDFIRNPKNKEFIDNTINFIKSIPDRLRQAREKIQPVIDFFVGMKGRIENFAKDFRQLLIRFPFLGDFFKTKEEKEDGIEMNPEEELFVTPGSAFGFDFPIYSFPSFKGGFGFDGAIPLLGSALMSGGAFLGDAVLGTQPANAGTLPQNQLIAGSRSNGFYISPEERRMLDAISGAEGTKGYGTLYGGKNIPELAMGKMTINQVLNMQETGMYKGQSVYAKDEYDSTATGRYQFMPVVLREEAERAGLNLNTTKFTPELQDELILRRIRRMRGVTPGMLKSEGMSDKVIDRLAPEFASFPNLFGPDHKGRDIQGTSFYGQGGKSADFIKDLYNKSSGMKMSPTPPPVLPPPGLPSGTGKSVDNRFDGIDLDFIFKPIRQFFGVDTPYAPTSSKIIVLPPIRRQAKQPTKTQTSNEIPDFRVSSGVQMRDLVGQSLGIKDLVERAS